jgi:DNA-binding response OmpR family regulator
LGVYLEKAGFLVFKAANAVIALEMLEMLVPNVIMMDYQMPGLNGIDAINLIRKKNKRTAIIMMTAYSSEEVAIEAIRSQADDFLPKPLNFSEIPKIAINHIKKREELFPPVKEQFRPVSESIINHLLIMKDSFPLLSYGTWNNENRLETNYFNDNHSDDDTLISGFISAIQSFSSTIFGQKLSEISMGNYQLLMHQKDDYLICVTVLQDTYRWLLSLGVIEYIYDALNNVLENLQVMEDDQFGMEEGMSFVQNCVSTEISRVQQRLKYISS